MIALTTKTRLLARMTTLAAVGAVMVLSTGPVANASAPVTAGSGAAAAQGVNWGGASEGVSWGGVS
ncbi:MAG: hypothetical protein M3513_18595, partial [Actinomycetota bacterium]|nr:hypothetical protein [Actinomycetota bacterium]